MRVRMKVLLWCGGTLAPRRPRVPRDPESHVGLGGVWNSGRQWAQALRGGGETPP